MDRVVKGILFVVIALAVRISLGSLRSASLQSFSVKPTLKRCDWRLPLDPARRGVAPPQLRIGTQPDGAKFRD